MDNQVIFKTAIGGFDKKSVLDYVYALTQKAEEAQAKLEEQIKYVAEEKAVISEQVAELKAEVQKFKDNEDNVRVELEGERRRSLEMSELVATQEEMVRELNRLVDDRTRQMDDYVKRTGEITDRNQALEKERLEIEKASVQIGKLVVESRTEAERIVAEAQDKAGAIIAGAKQKSDEVLMDAGNQAQHLIEKAKEDAERMTGLAQESIDSAYEKFSTFRAEISSLQRRMLEVMEEMHEKAAHISSDIDDAQRVLMQQHAHVDIHEVEEIAASYEHHDTGYESVFSYDNGSQDSGNAQFFRANPGLEEEEEDE